MIIKKSFKKKTPTRFKKTIVINNNIVELETNA